MMADAFLRRFQIVLFVPWTVPHLGPSPNRKEFGYLNGFALGSIGRGCTGLRVESQSDGLELCSADEVLELLAQGGRLHRELASAWRPCGEQGPTAVT